MLLNKRLILSGVAALLLFSGCAKDQLVLPTYKPPKKQEQVKKMIENSDVAQGFINIQIFEDVRYICEPIGLNKDSKYMALGLITNVKKFINQTNFISLNQVEDTAAVSLDMQVTHFEYTQTQNSRALHIVVNFVVRKNGVELYSKPYVYKTLRKSRAGLQGIDSKNELLNQASEYLAKKFIKDISPIKTKKLVELKELPKELAFTISYAKGGNFKGAVEAMEKYSGEKEVAYYYDLAVYYEGYGTQTDNMKFFAKAKENYEKAMAMGGFEDETIVNGKMKFDKFYDIIQKVSKQQKLNQKQISTSEYEIVE